MKNKLLTLFAFLAYTGFLFAEDPTPPGGGGGEGTDGFGTPDETPIDMFLIPLAVLAIVFIVMYAVKVSKTRSLK